MKEFLEKFIKKNFTKDFPLKKKNEWESFVKCTQIEFKENSFVKFSAGGPRSIYKGIPLLKLKRQNFRKDFLVKQKSMVERKVCCTTRRSD